jgi:hypothetical protein
VALENGHCLGFSSKFLDQLGKLLLGELGPVLRYFGGIRHTPVNQNTLEPADSDDGQGDALIFVGLEFAGQALSGFPDVGGEILEFGMLSERVVS